MERVLQSAGHTVIANKATVRACALKFDVSKSTVHKDLTERLDKIDADLRKKVKAVLDVNLNERHIRAELLPRKNTNRKTRNEKGGVRQSGSPLLLSAINFSSALSHRLYLSGCMTAAVILSFAKGMSS